MFEKLANQLREAREKKELSQELLAKTIKMDLRFLRMLESGDFSFLPELYVKAFVRSYAKAVGLNPEIAIQKFNIALDGGNIDEVSFFPPPKPAAPKATTPVPPAPTQPKSAGLPPDIFDVPAQQQPAVQEQISESAKEPVATTAAPAPTQSPEPQPVQFHEVTPPIRQYPHSQPVRRYEDVAEAPPRKKRTMNAMQKRMAIFAGLSILILAVAGIAIYESTVSKSIVVENGQQESATDTAQSRYEAPPKPAAALQGDSLVLRMEFSDLCWVSVKPDSTGESSENTFNKMSEPAEFKAAHRFVVIIGNPPGVRLLVNNKEMKYDHHGPNSVRLEITKDTARVISFPGAKTDSKGKN